MKLKKPFFLLVILCMTLNNCSGLKEASNVLKNEKSSSTDEFLIQKKEALTKPPDFDIIPKPNSIENKSIVDKKKKNIKELLKTSQTESEGSSSKSSSSEDSILSQIKK